MWKVAVVEDEQESVQKLEAYIRQYGDENGEEFQISFFGNGEEILASLDAGFDVILLDIEMPVMNGIEATKRLKADPRYSHIPVIALTAHNLEEFNEMFAGTGFDGLLEKPYSCEGISEVLTKF
jgi:CheY-like chemotaxis protein